MSRNTIFLLIAFIAVIAVAPTQALPQSPVSSRVTRAAVPETNPKAVANAQVSDRIQFPRQRPMMRRLLSRVTRAAAPEANPKAVANAQVNDNIRFYPTQNS